MIPRTIVWLIHVYQILISPVIHFLGGSGSGCRFYPTCSAYAIEAVREHGAVRGMWISFRRILRCNPWGGHGFDPVPSVKDWSDVLENRIRK
ncbi:MAG: membrane protein insertion efficiency factor YidD [Verrucomicrobiota bacterium]